jgi:hypothetical protein
LGMYLFIVFCVHGMAAWVAFGSERISYMGLQIAIAFDLGVLRDYGPPREIDPIRDRFIGIVLGIIIISAVFSLVWPESARALAREKLAACLQSIARLLLLDASKGSQSQREQLELEIGSRLSEANLFVEQATFEMLLYGIRKNEEPDLGKVIEATQEIYVASLPWIREQGMRVSPESAESAQSGKEIAGRLAQIIEGQAVIERPFQPDTVHAPLTTDQTIEQTDWYSAPPSDSLKELGNAVTSLEVLTKSVSEGKQTSRYSRSIGRPNDHG